MAKWRINHLFMRKIQAAQKVIYVTLFALSESMLRELCVVREMLRTSYLV